MLLGPYRVGAYSMAGRVRLTNKTPCGTYRAPGRFESTFVRERLMDAIAAQLGLDAAQVRRRNLIPARAMPYARHLDTLGTEMTYDSGDYAALLDKALAAARWPALRNELKQRRAGGETVGAGFAMFVEKSGLGPFDCVHAAVDSVGTVEIVTGATSVGQGMETVLAQICADELGIDYRQVRVVHGQTDRIAYGMGTFASRVTVMAGEATRRGGGGGGGPPAPPPPPPGARRRSCAPKRSPPPRNCCNRRPTLSSWSAAGSRANTRREGLP
jgi:CO/xanthine dehydrogenase Mo-binding subunit